MERTTALSPTSGGPKVSQIANKFQGSSSSSSSSGDDTTPKRHCEAKSRIGDSVSPLSSSPKEAASTPVVRTESHAARFNNARALFEKLGVESRLVSRPAALNGKMSKDTANGCGGDATKNVAGSPDKMSNGSGALRNGSNSSATSGATPATTAGAKIFNVSRPKPEKPEKPERKFNSRELIEKQKNWTSHFSKARSSPRFNSDPNRCDIIRTVPPPNSVLITKGSSNNGSDVISSTGGNSSSNISPVVSVAATSPPAVPQRQQISQSFDAYRSNGAADDDDDIPPCPPIRQNSIPEIKPRSIKPVIVGATTAAGSPVKIIVRKSPETSPEKLKGEYNNNNNNNSWGEDAQKKGEDVPEKPRKKSFDLISDGGGEMGRSRSQSLDKENIISPGIGLSSSSSPMASISSEPTSPIHTEDEKQENEANEKTDRRTGCEEMSGSGTGLKTPTDGIDRSEGTDSGEFIEWANIR